MNNTLKNYENNRIVGLDVVRFIAIMSVVVYHAMPIIYPLTGLPVVGRPLHFLFALTEPLGILGVEIFFSLSGFLIGSILIRMYMSSEQFGLTEVRSFLVRRWFRTLPNYWLILVVSFVVYFALGIRSFQAYHLKYFLFLQNLDSSHPRFFPEAWSLAVEEWFYLTAPVVLLLISAVFRTKTKKKRLILLLVLYPLGSIILRTALADNNNPDPLYFDRSVRKVVIMRLSSINYGVIIAFVQYFYARQVTRFKKPLLFSGLFGITALTAIHYVGIHPRFGLYSSSHTYRFFHNVILITLIPFCASLTLPFAYSIRSLRNYRISAIITFISKISYSLYLTHFTLVLQVLLYFIQPSLTNCIPLYVGYWIAIISLSAVIYHYYEMPVMKLRNKISKADPPV